MATGAERRQILRKLVFKALVGAVVHVQDRFLRACVADAAPHAGGFELGQARRIVAPGAARDVAQIAIAARPRVVAFHIVISHFDLRKAIPLAAMAARCHRRPASAQNLTTMVNGSQSPPCAFRVAAPSKAKRGSRVLPSVNAAVDRGILMPRCFRSARPDGPALHQAAGARGCPPGPATNRTCRCVRPAIAPRRDT